MTLLSLWNYYRDKTDDFDDNKSFKYKTKIIKKTAVPPLQSGNADQMEMQIN